MTGTMVIFLLFHYFVPLLVVRSVGDFMVKFASLVLSALQALLTRRQSWRRRQRPTQGDTLVTGRTWVRDAPAEDLHMSGTAHLSRH